MASKVAYMAADGTEAIELTTPVDVLRRGGVDVSVVSVMGREDVSLSQDVDIKADAVLEDVDLSTFDMVVVPGGSGGVDILIKCEPLLEALRQFSAQDKRIGSICAGPMVLAEAGILDGRRATCYPGCDTQFPHGVYAGKIGVVNDANLITASGPGQALDFAFALLASLEGDSVADQVANGMLISR